MRRSLFVIALITCFFFSPNIAKSQTDQTVTGGAATAPVVFSSTGCVYTWTCDNPSIGLAANGIGDISSFTAINNGNIPVKATITATPAADSYAYITISPNNSVSVLSRTANVVLTSIPVGVNPVAVAVSPDAKKVYISNLNDKSVSVIDAVANQVVTTISIGIGASHLLMSADGSRLYATNSTSGTISVINTSLNQVISTISAGTQPASLVLSTDGTKLYVCDETANAIYIINTATNAIMNTIHGINDPTAICISPDGSRLYIASGNIISNQSGIVIVNTATNLIITSAILGSALQAMILSPDGNTLYVSDTNSVHVINTTNNTILTNLIFQAVSPEGLSISTDGSKLYIVNKQGSMVVVNTATYAMIANIFTGPATNSIGNFITEGIGCNGLPVTFTITVNPQPALQIGGGAGILTGLSTVYGVPSNSDNFTISGNNLASRIIVTAPTGFEVSLDNVTFSKTLTAGGNGSVASTEIYVRLASTSAGAYSGLIVLSSTGANNINEAIANSTVSPAELTITADNKKMTFGKAIPVLTATYSGFVNGDGETSLTTPSVISTTATATSPVGKYTITASGAASLNYTFTYLPGVITIVSASTVVAIPNSFTPNGDGINDIWNIQNLDNYPNCTVEVFNRNGGKVFYSRTYPIPWDGRFNGGNIPAGVYYYIVNLNNGNKPFTGWLAVIR